MSPEEINLYPSCNGLKKKRGSTLSLVVFIRNENDSPRYIHLKMKRRNVLCDAVEAAMLLKLVDHPDTL